jgi:uncharacterized membrane protein YfcA
MGFPYAELAMIAGGLLVAGAITGLLAGLFGVGGGAVIVPVLYELFAALGVPDEIRMPLCVGTSLAIIIPTSIQSFRAHRRRGAVDMSILRVWAIPVIAGVVAGSFVARFAPAELFKWVFVLVASISALRLLFGKDSWRFAGDIPGKALMRVYGAIIGLLSALMGIGGGQLSSLFMTFYGRPIHQAVATSSGLGVLISIPGALGYIYAGWPRAAEYADVAAVQLPMALGYVSLIGFILVVPTSMLLAPLGARVAHALPKRRLELAFGLFLLLVAGRFLFDLLT